MKYCRNCGNEIAEGVKFCANCGEPIEKSNELEKQGLYHKLSRFFGVILFILAIVDFQSDPAFVTLVLSVAIIAGAIFCLSQKYKLKFFTIVALILAVMCLVAGIKQSKQMGLFTTPAKYYDKITEDSEKNKKDTIGEDVIQDSIKGTVESTGGIDPDLKAFLDSYESFMDEYVDFMKKYMEDPGNAVSMLSDYMRILSEYEDFAKMAEAYDPDKMSTEDAKYYLEVINRCNQKLLE